MKSLSSELGQVEIVSASCSGQCARVVILVLALCLGTVVGASAGYEWQIREQVTPYNSDYGYLAKQIVPSNTEGDYHLVVRRWPWGT